MFSNPDLQKLVFGRLSLEDIPYHEPILQVTFAMVALGGLVVLGAITYYRFWGPLWRDWLTSVDHKKIGVMYIVLAFVMLLRGFADALMMRAQQAVAFGATCRRTTTTRSSRRTA
jgi:cytochrome o ubiquinol oxidase subunit 1